MKKNSNFCYGILVLILFAFLGCKKDRQDDRLGPVITISKDAPDLKDLNAGQEVTIPVNVKSTQGIKRLAYFFIKQTPNGTESGTPVYYDNSDYPSELNKDIVFNAEPDMVELVIVSFDKQNHSSEVHLEFKDIRELPVLTFTNGIKYSATVFENKHLSVTGHIDSKYDLSKITYTTIVNNAESQPADIPFTDKKSTDFNVEIIAKKGLSAIIIKAINSYNGVAVDTFKIGNVVDDAVAIALAGGVTSIDKVYAGIPNTLSGTVSSGSNMTSLTYALKVNGVYGAETAIPLGTPLDDFDFTIKYEGAKNIEAVRITGQNAGNKQKVLEIPVSKVYTKLLDFTVQLTTEIGPGKHNWFAAYQAPHVFDVSTAASVETMLDFAFVKYSETSFRIMPGAVVQAGSAYMDAMAPYMNGFTQATYTMVSANRKSITPEAFDTLEWDGDLTSFLETKIEAPTSEGGENYHYKTTNRRLNSALEAGKGFIIGWGAWQWGTSVADNQAFGLVMVKEYSVNNGVASVTLEIKVPDEDNRTKYNPVSIHSYP